MRHAIRRLTLLLLLVAFSGCAIVDAEFDILLGGEPAVDPTAARPALPANVPTMTVMLLDSGKSPVEAEYPLLETTSVQNVLAKTGLQKRFRRMKIELYRPAPAGTQRLEVKYDSKRRQVYPAFDYAVRPGDRLVVEEDTRSVLDDMLESASLPFGPGVRR